MKVSKTQKAKIRDDLLKAAVALFTEKGALAATMREISSRAGYSAGTIYSYFPSKDKIFSAYFESQQAALFATLSEIDDFNDYTLKEKLQSLFEMLLETYLPDREFIVIAYKSLMDSPMRSFSELKPIKDRFAAEVEAFLRVAVENNEIAPQPFERFLSHLVWDYKNLIVMYWLRDDSEGFVNTSRLIDMSLDVFVAAVSSGIVTKTADVCLFLLRSHLFGNIDRLFDVVNIFSGMRPAGVPTRDGE